MEATSEFVLRIKTEVENVSETVFLDLKIVKIKVIKMNGQKVDFCSQCALCTSYTCFLLPFKKAFILVKSTRTRVVESSRKVSISKNFDLERAFVLLHGFCQLSSRVTKKPVTFYLD